MKWMFPLWLTLELIMYIPAAPVVALLLRKAVFPVNVRLLLRAVMLLPPKEFNLVLWLCVKSVFPARVTLALFTASAVPLNVVMKGTVNYSVVYSVKSKCSANVPAKGLTSFLLQELKARKSILKSTMCVKLSPTEPLQTIGTMLPEEDPPCMVSLAMLTTVMFLSRIWSPGKNTIVVSENSGILRECGALG